MNLLLVTPAQVLARDGAVDRVALDARQREHVLTVHRAALGDPLRVGERDGRLGVGEVVVLSPDRIELAVTWQRPPPPRQDLVLLLALPRPKMLRRLLQMVCTFGITELVLLNSYRVEKSYWQTPWLAPGEIEHQLQLGLEQAGDTVAPRITLVPRFKPFVEDELPARLQGRSGWVAHPGVASPCPDRLTTPGLLAIGPEGGFIPYELARLAEAGLQPVALGQRILRVETAVAALLGRCLS